MSRLATVLLSALELEDDDLLAAALRDDLSLNLRALHQRSAKRGRISTEEKDLVKSDLVSRCAIEFFDAHEVALSDAVLFAAGADNCVCHGEGPRKLDPTPDSRKELGHQRKFSVILGGMSDFKLLWRKEGAKNHRSSAQ